MNSLFKKYSLIFIAAIWMSGCGALQNPQPEPFYGQTAPPAAQELRWSNGASLPKNFDPPLASAAPETDAVRAIYEGLTDLEAKTLHPVPAAAARWEASEDSRTWTFYLRQNGRWSNGKSVTAKDFVRSWQRAARLGDKAPHNKLLANIVGARQIQNSKFKIQNSTGNLQRDSNLKSEILNAESQSAEEQNAKNEEQRTNDETQIENRKSKIENPAWFGAEAVGDFVLRVYLVEPDKDFAALVAHPIFRPVWEDASDSGTIETAARIVTNGAFRLASADKSEVTLERSKNYWDAQNVRLERIRFVPKPDAESALAAYRGGEVDAVTNANFEPLAAKLLASYKDFRRTAFNAVTFYEFNQARQPFSDKRVRQALAAAIDRERLTRDEMDGATEPATSFLPYLESKEIKYDSERARKLLGEAGFENGKDFPKIRLVVNRNDLQRRLARAVAEMWRKNLGVETEIVVKNQPEYETAVAEKDFDLARRVVVLPTTDEMANLTTMFEKNESSAALAETKSAPESAPSPTVAANVSPTPASDWQTKADAESSSKATVDNGESQNAAQRKIVEPESNTAEVSSEDGKLFERLILTEAEAVEELPAIPLYFPSSYALIKPYVKGFEPNLLDAPSLKYARIEANWQQQ